MDNQITLYGNRNEVKDLAERLQATIPGGRKMAPEEAKTLAQIAVAHGLDPFNGEVWVIPGSGAMVGIKGLRKAARKQAREEGGSYWTEITRVEPEKYNAPKDAVVYECVLRDSVTMQAWSKSINMITTSGVPYQDAVAMIGKPPVYIGIGIANQAERSKMEIHQRARKRAEADATKQRYDVDFGAEFSADEPDAVEFVDTVVTEVAPRPAAEIITELGYDAPEQTGNGSARPYPPAALFAKIEDRSKVHATKVAPDRLRKAIAATLDTIFDGEKTKRYELCKWLTGKSSTKDIPDAYVHALSDWLGVTDFSQPPHEHALTEARTALAEALKAAGQQELL